MSKKLVIGAVIVVIAVMAIVMGTKSPDTSEKKTIKIGYIGPLTGNVAFIGQGVKNAAELALGDLQAKSTKYKYELIFEDDGFDPKRSASAASKLINIDKVDALVSVASGAGSVVSPIAEAAHVVHIGIAGDPNVAKGDYNFINWTPPSEEVKTFIIEAQKRNIKKISIFGQQISGIIAVTEELKRQAIVAGIQVVSEDISNFGTKDFRTVIGKAKAANPDYFVVVMFSPELEVLARQIKELGIKIPLTSIESFELTDAPALFEGLWYANAADPTLTFANAYMSKYGKTTSIATANAYDTVGLIANAVETFDGKTKPSEKEIADTLTKTKNYNGALGKGLSINSEGFVISKAVIRMIKDGKPVTIK